MWSSKDIIDLMGEPTAGEIRKVQLILNKSIKKVYRIYIKNSSEAPIGVKVERGKRGGLYYESTTPQGDVEQKPQEQPPEQMHGSFKYGNLKLVVYDNTVLVE